MPPRRNSISSTPKSVGASVGASVDHAIHETTNILSIVGGLALLAGFVCE